MHQPHPTLAAPGGKKTVWCCGTARSEADHAAHLDNGWEAHVDSAMKLFQ